MPTLHHSLDEPAPTETDDLPNPETAEDVIDRVAIRLTVRAKLRDELSFSSFRYGGFT